MTTVAKTLLALNDNFPGGGGRSAAPDDNEFLQIHLDDALDLRCVEDDDQDED